MKLDELGYKLYTESQETNRLLRLLGKRLDQHERILQQMKRRIATTTVPIYAETDEVSYDEVMETLGNLIKPNTQGGIVVQGEIKGVDDDEGDGVTRIPMPDQAWVVVYTTKGEITAMFYEDKLGNRVPVVVDDAGNVIVVRDDAQG